MKMDVRVLGQPSIAFFVRAVIVQNHMQFLFGGSFGDHVVQELEEFLAAFELRDRGFDLAGRDFQCRKQIEGSFAGSRLNI